jgi:large subunit ribosomal protein L32
MDAPTLVACASCGEPMVPHRVCPSCGAYKKREVIAKPIEETEAAS